jgi:RNase P/RNase MRP subunit POP5
MKPILPTLKENPRYVQFKISSKQTLSAKDAQIAVLSGCKRFLGELGVAKAGIQFMKYDTKNQSGVLKTNSKMLNETKAALALIKDIKGKKATVSAEKVSGILRKL